ncbi:hypothetical protein H0H81_001009 [Sphagnurus paluster]|uniref:Peptidase S8/S53 domain-containing protein n=1 Tax=Sphagnurus paluster TaxID=117069 RepID=A0A9P7FML5_9AGAR|nr:hypothetical protein H0H81_001009 [Sphagnurus paluster]
MQFLAVVLAAVSLAVPALTASKPIHTIQKFKGQTNGKYVVKLKEGVSKATVLAEARLSKPAHADWTIINGFTGELSTETLEALRANPSVEYIASCTLWRRLLSSYTSSYEFSPLLNCMAFRTNAPWGLARLNSIPRLTSQDTSTLNYNYTYDSSAGAGVDVYVVDTGVHIAHSTFGDRARWGATFGGYASADGNGHGTHCAGTIAGSQYGIAKAANIIAVKVLSDGGPPRHLPPEDLKNLIQYFGTSPALDSVVTALTNQGIHVIVAAGNSNTDAGSTSPARAPGAVTVGASNIADARASFSNYGPVVDIFAPGQNVISSWIGSTTATPHVAGLVAYLIGLQGNISPADMTSTLKSLSLKAVITGIPTGTVDNLAHSI